LQPPIKFKIQGLTVLSVIQLFSYLLSMKEKETYNEAIEKLRTIVAEIERGELDIDELSRKVKEASSLIQLCKEKLLKADEEVKKILEELE